MTTPTTPEALATEVDRHWLEGDDLACWCTCGEWRFEDFDGHLPEVGERFLPFSKHVADAIWSALRDAIALGVAWAAVEAALPSGWCLSVESDADVDETDWVAMAGPNAQKHIGGLYTTGSTPTEALTALHAALLAREEGSR
jgi:hypothetical protein